MKFFSRLPAVALGLVFLTSGLSKLLGSSVGISLWATLVQQAPALAWGVVIAELFIGVAIFFSSRLRHTPALAALYLPAAFAVFLCLD